ncbi:TcfC E-set like domain-containing protein [Vibrio owensii]|uniref:TcfC E-set like domain-containing protein n=1 Tax=Vibrio owensii TaxID=696485 RepID=UPI00391B1E2D
MDDPEALRTAILNSGIKEKYVEEIIKDISSGQDVEEKDGVSSTFSAERKSMVIKVPAAYLDAEKEKERYTTLTSDDPALIVGNQLFANYYDGDADATVNTDIIAGLGNGYISADLTFSGGDTNSSAFDSDQIFYEYNRNSVVFRAGYGAFSVEKNNSTSNLDYVNSDDNYYVSIGSSDNLFISDDRDYKNIYFDIKSAGTVDVLRDGRTIYSQSFLKGQHGINYKHLPRGNYDVELVIRADGYPEERIFRRVNNNVARTSHNGYDYNITFRNSSYDSGFGDEEQESDRLTFGDVSFTKSLLHDSVLVGVSGQSDGDSVGLGGLVKYSNGTFDVGAYYNKVDDGVLYAGSLNVSGFNLDYQEYGRFDNQNISKVSPLQKAMYGVQPFTQATLSYSFPVLSSNMTLYGSQTQYDEAGSRNAFENKNLSVNYNTVIFKDLQLNLGFNRTENYNTNQEVDIENIYSAAVVIPLGDSHTTYSSGFDSSDKTGPRITNTLTNEQDDIDIFNDVDTNITASVNSYIDGEQSESTLNGQVDIGNDQFSAGMYANLSNNSASNLSINAQSTSIITESGIYQTKQNNEVYAIVNSEAREDRGNETDFGVLDSQVNSEYHISTPIDSTTKVIGLNEFKNYKFQIDSEISGYKSSGVNHDGKREMFGYPGSVHNILNKVEPIETYLSYFEDFNKKSLNNVKCIGSGCVSVGRVGDGIYSISVLKDKPYKVASNGEYCYVESGSLHNNSGMAKCFPKIDIQDDGMQLVNSGLGDGKENIYYLGVLNGEIPKVLLEKSKSVKVKYIKYKFANKVHLFASSDVDLGSNKSFEVVRKQIFEDIQNYVKNDSESDFFADNR